MRRVALLQRLEVRRHDARHAQGRPNQSGRLDAAGNSSVHPSFPLHNSASPLRLRCSLCVPMSYVPMSSDGLFPRPRRDGANVRVGLDGGIPSGSDRSGAFGHVGDQTMHRGVPLQPEADAGTTANAHRSMLPSSFPTGESGLHGRVVFSSFPPSTTAHLTESFPSR